MEKRTTLSLLFFIRKTRLLKNGDAPIYMRITVKGIRADIALNRGISPKLWSSAGGTAMGNSKASRSINMYIESVRTQIHQHLTYLREDDISISAEALKNAYLGIDNNSKFVIQLFKEHNERIRKLSGIDFAPDTIQRYETSLMHTQEFIKLNYLKDDINVKEVDHKFICDYEFYFKTVRKCSHNTTMKYIKNFKKIIRIALVNGFITKDPFVNCKLTLKKTDRGFLTEEQLDTLINKRMVIKRLEQVRDCFVFSCFTGLAHSDLKLLSKENIVIGTDGGQWIKTHRKKTGNSVAIPIFPVTQRIIDKYADDEICIMKSVLLPVLTNQKMNAYLKEIAEVCGIPLNLTSHIARHTFATTVTLNNNVSIESVSKMLGHSSISMTKIYARMLDKRVGHDTRHLHDKFDIAI